MNWHFQSHGSQSEKDGVPTPGLARVTALGGSILVSQGLVHKLEEINRQIGSALAVM